MSVQGRMRKFELIPADRTIGSSKDGWPAGLTLISFAAAFRLPRQPAVLVISRSRHTQARPTLARPTRLESGHLPNPPAIVNDRINRMEPEQYPPSPALARNEPPPHPRLTGTDYKKSILKLES